MRRDIIHEKTDLKYLKWSHIRASSGTAGSFLKSGSNLDGKKKYYKLSNYDPVMGVVGHECINEIIAGRLLDLLGVEHLNYELIHADIIVDGKILETYLCSSDDFKKRNENKTAIDNFSRIYKNHNESAYDFCVRMGFKEYIDRMIAFDYIILNRDRHGGNIEVLRNSHEHTIRLAPLFDHGLSLLYSCLNESEVLDFDINEDKKCNNFIGCYSCLENLHLLSKGNDVFNGVLSPTDKIKVFSGLDTILPGVYLDKIWDMIWKRYNIYRAEVGII